MPFEDISYLELCGSMFSGVESLVQICEEHFCESILSLDQRFICRLKILLI